MCNKNWFETETNILQAWSFLYFSVKCQYPFRKQQICWGSSAKNELNNRLVTMKQLQQFFPYWLELRGRTAGARERSSEGTNENMALLNVKLWYSTLSSTIMQEKYIPKSWFWTPNTCRQQCNGKNSVLSRFE